MMFRKKLQATAVITLIAVMGISFGPSGNSPDIITNSIGMELVKIPAGKFIMGGNIPSGDMAASTGEPESRFSDQFPAHEVIISKPFFMGKTEVTRAQFEKFVVETKYVTFAEKDGRAFSVKNGEWVMVDHKQWRNPYFFQGPDHPVVSVTYPDLLAFCKWLSKKEGKNYRLPTEAEWEYAYRAGSTGIYPWGDTDAGCEGWGNAADLSIKKSHKHWKTYDWEDGYPNTSPVASFRPNAFGLYDMFGNVWEWCNDFYDEKYYEVSPPSDPPGPLKSSEDPSNPHHCLRGGSWSSEPFRNHCGWRDASGIVGAGEDMGFRVVMEILP